MSEAARKSHAPKVRLYYGGVEIGKVWVVYRRQGKADVYLLATNRRGSFAKVDIAKIVGRRGTLRDNVSENRDREVSRIAVLVELERRAGMVLGEYPLDPRPTTTTTEGGNGE